MDKVFKAAVVGHPVKHSLSPEIFKCFSKESGKKVSYQKWDIDPARFSFQMKTKIESAGTNWVGCNVTIPYKQRILKSLNRVKGNAGAINVVKKTNSGLVGYNTDTLGIAQTLRDHKVKVRGKKTLVFGAGGAARAFCLVMKQSGAKEVHVLNRSFKNGKKLCAVMNRTGKIKFKSIRTIDKTEKYYLIVNATPQGPEINIPSKFAFDMVYRPRVTDFLRSAKKAGAYPIGGLKMLVWQAWATWEIWFGKPPVHPRKVLAIEKKLKRFL